MADQATDVVIVGAGAAGLACASRLRQAGIKFVVVEASERVGGRARSDYSFAHGKALELGALLVHGSRAVTHRWIRELGLHTRRFHRPSGRLKFSVSRRLGSFPFLLLPFHPVFGPRRFAEFVRLARAISAYQGPDLPLGDFFAQRALSPPARAFAELVFGQSSGSDASRVGLLGLAEETRASDQPHLPNFLLVEGYGELMKRQAATFGETIRLRSRVERIRVGADGVHVSANSGPGQPKAELLGRCAVVTVPLSVLKAGLIEFDPPLPDSKRKAIDSVSFGQAIMVYLRLPGRLPFWRGRSFGVLWGNTSSVFAWRGPSWTGTDHTILNAFTTGPEALRRSALSDEEIVERTITEFRSILPLKKPVSPPVDHLVHRWPQEPYARGAYSYLGVGSRLSDRSSLAEPVGDRLYFAGEATHDKGQAATVHGAIETGYRAAAEVLKALGRPEAEN